MKTAQFALQAPVRIDGDVVYRPGKYFEIGTEFTDMNGLKFSVSREAQLISCSRTPSRTPSSRPRSAQILAARSTSPPRLPPQPWKGRGRMEGAPGRHCDRAALDAPGTSPAAR